MGASAVAVDAAAGALEIYAAPFPGATVTRHTAFSACRDCPTAVVWAFVLTIGGRVVAVVVTSVAQVQCIGMNGGVAIVAVVTSEVAVIVEIGCSRHALTPLAHFAGVWTFDVQAGVVVDTRTMVAVGPLGTDDVDAGVVRGPASIVNAGPTWGTPPNTLAGIRFEASVAFAVERAATADGHHQEGQSPTNREERPCSDLSSFFSAAGHERHVR